MTIIDNKLSFKNNYSIMSNVEGIVLHHSGVSVLQTVETIHNYHISRGYCGIGYHYYIRKDGNIYKGRPENYQGAHCIGANSNTIGICAEGNFEEEQMTEKQKQAIKELILNIKSRYNIKFIKGHKEIYHTNCPGKNYPLNELKQTKIEDNSFTTFVKEVQKAIGARVDGISGPETFSKTITISTLKNNKHAVVKAVQKYLISLGYNLGSYGADGIFGNCTRTAVIKFQQNNNCIADGEITARCKTWKTLLKL